MNIPPLSQLSNIYVAFLWIPRFLTINMASPLGWVLAVCLLIGATHPPTITIRGGGYSGTCTNQTYGISANLKLILHENGDQLTGSLEIHGQLVGGGPIAGVIEGDQVTFQTSGSFGTIVWSGKMRGKIITGTYLCELPDGSRQEGIWSVSR